MMQLDHLSSVDDDGDGRDGDAKTTIDSNVEWTNALYLKVIYDGWLCGSWGYEGMMIKESQNNEYNDIVNDTISPVSQARYRFQKEAMQS